MKEIKDINEIFRKLIAHPDTNIIHSVEDLTERVKDAFELHSEATSVKTQEFEQFVNYLSYLREGFSAVTKEAQKLVNVLIKRANTIDLSMPLSINNIGIDATLRQNVGIQDKVTYENYVSMLILKNNMAATDAINIDENNDNISDFTTNNEMNVLNAVINQYENYLIDQNAEDFTIASKLVSIASQANSAIASIDNVAKTAYDTITEFNATSENNDTKYIEKLKQLFESCFPCEGRLIELKEKFSLSKEIMAFIAVYFSKLISLINQVIKYKNFIAPGYILENICNIYFALTNYVCVPDLAMVKSILQSFLSRLKNLIKSKIRVDVQVASIEFMLHALIDMLYSSIVNILNAGFGVYDCVISNIEAIMRRLTIGNDFNQARYAKNNIYFTFINILKEGKRTIDDYVTQVFTEIMKLLGLENKKYIDYTNLIINIALVKQFLMLLGEIIYIYKEFKDKIIKDKLSWKTFAKQVCFNAMSLGRPWYHYYVLPNDDVKDILNPPDYKDEDPKDNKNNVKRYDKVVEKEVLIKDEENIDYPINKDDDENNKDFPSEKDFEALDNEVMVIVDDSLDKDFDDDALEKVISNTIFKDLNNLFTSTQTILNINPLVVGKIEFDQESYNQYIEQKTKNRELTNLLKLKKYTDQYISNSYIVINFSSCIKANQEISQEQIQEWINRL